MTIKPAGLLVEDVRTRAGLSQRALAARAGTAQSIVARIEGGQTNPTVGTLARLVEAAGFELRLDVVPKMVIDPIIEAFMRGVDRTLIRENLEKTPQQRMQTLVAMARLVDETHRAREKRAKRK